MTTGVQGNQADPSALAAQLAQAQGTANNQQAANKQGVQEQVAGGFEDLINDAADDGSGVRSTKKATTNKTNTGNKAGKASSTSKSTGASSASSIAQATAATGLSATQIIRDAGGIRDDGSASLPSPHSPAVNGVVLKRGMGTLSLMGLIMSLLAQANAESWSTQFQMQNQNLQMQMEMAPEIGAAIKQQAEHQAQATELQAKQQLISGVINCVSFAVSILGGILSAAKSLGGLKSASFSSETAAGVSSAASTAAKTATTGAASAAKAAVTGASEAASATAGALTKSMSSQASNAFSKALNTPGWKETAARGMNVVKTQGRRAMEFAGRAVSGALQASQLLHGLTAGIEGIAGGIIGTQVAEQQRLAGQQEAKAEVLKLMANLFGQYAGQAQQLQEQSAQAIREALQTLEQIANSQLQTTAAIFS